MELDGALEQLGHWGKFQIINYSLLCLPIIFYAVFEFTYVFTAKEISHRCFIPECERNRISTDFEPPWLRDAVPYKDDIPTKCHRYVPIGGVQDQNGTCSSQGFSRNITSCNDWVYDEYGVSIVSEDLGRLNGLNFANTHIAVCIIGAALLQWDVTCDDNNWKLTLVGTINNLGRFFGNPVSGVVSDRYGRRTILLGGLFFAGVAGLLRSFAINYAMFVAFEFIDPLFNAGLYSAAFILGMELMGPNKRVFWSAFTHCIYAVGEALLGFVAWEVQDWRWLLRAFYAPAVISIIALWILPESVRWLVSKGRAKEARSIIQKAARMNGIPPKQLGLEEMRAAFVGNDKKEVKEEITANAVLLDALKETLMSRILLCRLLNCSFCWITITFVYYGLSLHSVAVKGNQYLNFMLVCLIEAPACLVTYLMMEKVGRRASMCTSLVLSGVSCIAFLVVPEKMQWVSITTYLVGKFGITVSYSVVFVLTAELFPTSVRHTLFAFCSMIGRLGSIVAPQTPLLASYMKSLPMILFGAMSLTSGLTSLMFPETHGTKLPDSVQEAEDIGRNSPKSKTKSELDDPKAKKSINSIFGVEVSIPVPMQTVPVPSIPLPDGTCNGKVSNDDEPDVVPVRL